MITKVCIQCGSEFKKTINTSVFEWNNKRRYCSKKCADDSKIGKKVKQKISIELATRRKERMIGDKNPMWKGGDSDKERRNADYKKWRVSVFKRDGFKCTMCGYYNGNGEKRRDLNAHHIVKWIDSLSLRYEIDNGTTLCVPCHIKTHRNEHTSS